MKKLFHLMLLLLVAVYSLPTQAQVIERKVDDEEGVAYLTNALSLFSGCKMRMCVYHYKTGKVVYGIGLDMTDRVSQVSKGNTLTVLFKDGSTIQLENLYDTKADVHQEETYTTVEHHYTEMVPVFRSWRGFYAVPVDESYSEVLPVTRTTTFASLYYIITPEQIDKIVNGNVKDMSIVTDDKTIVKKARPLSKAIKKLFPAVKK